MSSRLASSRIANSRTADLLTPSLCANKSRNRLASSVIRILVSFLFIQTLYHDIGYLSSPIILACVGYTVAQRSRLAAVN